MEERKYGRKEGRKEGRSSDGLRVTQAMGYLPLCDYPLVDLVKVRREKVVMIGQGGEYIHTYIHTYMYAIYYGWLRTLLRCIELEL